MIFLTVGTQFPFDRLVRAVDQAVERSGCAVEIFAQIADSVYRPRCFDAVSYLQKDDFDKNMREASSIISHAGMGTITAALEGKKPLLVMPRLRKFGEVVNDHQVAIAKKFHILSKIKKYVKKSLVLELLHFNYVFWKINHANHRLLNSRFIRVYEKYI